MPMNQGLSPVSALFNASNKNPAAIEKYEDLFRIGKKTEIGLPGESVGRISGPDARHARKLSWHDGDRAGRKNWRNIPMF